MRLPARSAARCRGTLLILLLAAIALPPPARAEDLPVVTVTGRKEPVVRKIDKTVHDVTGLPAAANGTAQDVLQAIPEVSVTADGQLAVKGNSRVTVFVNGAPTALLSGDDGAVALQTMSGADIASVEVITNPSAAHNANGGAIVNIVLKRNRKPGAHAQLRGSAAERGLWNAGLSADLTRKNLSVHANLAHRQDGTLKRRRSAVDWNDPATGRTGEALQTSAVFVRRRVDSAALGVDVDLSETASLALSARYDARRSRPELDTLNITRSGADETMYHRISQGPNEQSDVSVSVAYTGRGQGSALKAMIQRSATRTLVDKSYRDVFVVPDRASAYSRAATRSARRLDQAALDWSTRSARGTSRGRWGLGLDLQDEANDLHNHRAAIDSATGAATPDPLTTNGYAVASTLAGAYVTGQLTHGRWEVLLGGRAERMALRVHPAQGRPEKTHWRAFNPSLHLNRAVSDTTDLALSYRRSLQRPDPRDLNPFTTYIDAQNLSRGNPGLGPQRLTAWELGVNTDRAGLSGGAGIFHRTGRDAVTDARSVADDVIVTTKRNGGRLRSTGITGSIEWKRDTRLRMGVDGGVYRVTLDTPDFDTFVRQERIAGHLNARVAYSVADDEVSLDAHFQSANVTPLVRHGPTSSVNLTWKHQVTRASSLTVTASDMFDGARRTYRTDTSTYRQAGFDHLVARRIQVGFVRKFD